MTLRRSGRRRPAACLILVLAGMTAYPPALAAAAVPGLDAAARSSEREMVELGLAPQSSGPALELPVDPAHYRLVPGDQLHLGLWGETARGYPLTVSPEGQLIIPHLGPIPVAGETIAAVESRLAEQMRSMYPRSRLSLRLLAPGRFRVLIAGMVERPGVYELTRLDRLTVALAQAGGIRAGGSLRQIRLTPPGAPTMDVDLLPWFLHGRPDANPGLSPGCAIEVTGRGPAVRVRGPVNGRSGLEGPGAAPPDASLRPADDPIRSLEWREGDTVAAILDAAGGLSDLASGEAVLYRDHDAGTRLDLLAPSDLARPLHAGDLLEVEHASRWVYVVGSVRLPGRYAYLPGMLVRDYVHMAGGPTELGRTSGWTIEAEDRSVRKVDRLSAVEPGMTVRVPERRAYTLSTILAPLASATALVLSLVAIAR